MKPLDKLIIKTGEIMAILKYSKQKTYRLIIAIKKKFKKNKRSYITIDELSEFVDWKEEKVRSALDSIPPKKREFKKKSTRSINLKKRILKKVLKRFGNMEKTTLSLCGYKTPYIALVLYKIHSER